MKLTCITATFNCIKTGNREDLVRCVESVAKLRTEHEHLVYDGASKDGTVGLLQELEKTTPGLRVVSEPDTGIYNPLNKGVRDAKGDWCYVLGADDYIEKPSVMDQILAKHDSDVIATPVLTETGVQGFSLENIFHGTPYCHQGVLHKTRLVRQYGGYNETYRIAADYDLMLKFHEDARNILYLDSQFAFFGKCGLSSTLLDEMKHEMARICAMHFGVSERVARRMAWRYWVPLSFASTYSSHPDHAFRVAAKHAPWKFLKHVLIFVFYPAVVARRYIIREYRSF